MKERIEAFMRDMHTCDAATMANWFTEDSELWIPPAAPIKGQSRIKALFRAMFSRYEFLSWDIVDIVPVSSIRCIHICNSRGKLKGRPGYSNRVITDIIFDEAGKISSLSDYFKDTSVFCR